MDTNIFADRPLLIAIGFMLSAIGVPLPSLALFALLVQWTSHANLPLWMGAIVGTGGTVAGHAVSFFAFRWLGRPALGWVKNGWPALDDLITRILRPVNSIMVDGVSWWLVPMRWASAGYAQAIWVFGTLPRLPLGLLGFLALNDAIWVLGWTYGLGSLERLVPVVGHWVNVAVPFLLAVYLLVAFGGLLFRRANSNHD